MSAQAVQPNTRRVDGRAPTGPSVTDGKILRTDLSCANIDASGLPAPGAATTRVRIPRGYRFFVCLVVTLLSGCLSDLPGPRCLEDTAQPTPCSGEFSDSCYDGLPGTPVSLIDFRPAARWPTTRITWTYDTDTFPEGVATRMMARAASLAFSRWGRESPLTFSFVSSGFDADIRITFETCTHNDAISFDGPFGRLGHTFAPGSGRDGEIHLDAEEFWSDEPGDGVVFLDLVVAHHVGHALGLEHSTNPSSIMAPGYPAMPSNFFRMSDDDISAIQRLYGSLDGTIPPASSPTLPGPPAPAGLDDPDLDGDGISDSYEVFVLGSDFDATDTDGNGIDDFTEVFLLGISPDGRPLPLPDCNTNGIPDGLDFDECPACVVDADCDPLICVDGTCVAEPTCLTDNDCDDAVFCNGQESCTVDGSCAAGAPPCSADTLCSQIRRECVPIEFCQSDADCDDGVCSNGAETCFEGQCAAAPPRSIVTLLDFEGAVAPPIASGGRVVLVPGEDRRILYLWRMEDAPDDAFIVFRIAPASVVSACDRVSLEIESDSDVTVRVELKSLGLVIEDVAAVLLPAASTTVIGVDVGASYSLVEIAVVIERDIHAPDAFGQLFIDDIQLSTAPSAED